MHCKCANVHFLVHALVDKAEYMMLHDLRHCVFHCTAHGAEEKLEEDCLDKAVYYMQKNKRTFASTQVSSVRRMGAEVKLIGDSFDETAKYARQRSADEGMTYIPPFDHPLVIAGQGTVGMEILRQTRDIQAVFVPVCAVISLCVSERV